MYKTITEEQFNDAYKSLVSKPRCYRYSLDRVFAKFLLKIGIESIEADFTNYIGNDLTDETDGLLLHENSITTKPFIKIDGTSDNAFYRALKLKSVRYSGGASTENDTYAQASWIVKYPHYLCPYKIVLYFNKLKHINIH